MKTVALYASTILKNVGNAQNVENNPLKKILKFYQTAFVIKAKRHNKRLEKIKRI